MPFMVQSRLGARCGDALSSGAQGPTRRGCGGTMGVLQRSFDVESGKPPALQAGPAPASRRGESHGHAACAAAHRLIANEQADRGAAGVGLREAQPGGHRQIAKGGGGRPHQIERHHAEAAGAHDEIERANRAEHRRTGDGRACRRCPARGHAPRARARDRRPRRPASRDRRDRMYRRARQSHRARSRLRASRPGRWRAPTTGRRSVQRLPLGASPRGGRDRASRCRWQLPSRQPRHPAGPMSHRAVGPPGEIQSRVRAADAIFAKLSPFRAQYRTSPQARARTDFR